MDDAGSLIISAVSLRLNCYVLRSKWMPVSRHDYETLLTPDAGGASLQGVRTRVHTGVGVVTPASFIREALDDEELLELRRQADREEAARRSSECGNLAASESDLELK
jgi:hypothetical protein